MKTVRIRRARSNDKENILKIISRQRSSDAKHAEKYYHRYFQEKDRPQDRVFVAMQGKRIIGVSGYFHDDYVDSNIYWLGWTYVAKEFQRKGMGKRLINRIFRELRQRGARKIYVDTSSKSFYRGAYKFYIENGFQTEGVFKDYYGKGEDQIVLSKEV